MEYGAQDYLGEYTAEYRTFIDTVIARGESCAFEAGDSPDKLMDIMTIFMSSSPLRALVTNIQYDNQAYAFTIAYRYDAYGHKASVDYLRHEYTRILDEIIRPGDNDVDKMIAVYTYFAQRFAYDYSFDPELGKDIYVFDALQNGLGVCHTFARACRFALAQLGIETCEGRGVADNGAWHEWFLAKLNGEWYHFDPTFENGVNCGTGLEFFGMDDEARKTRDIGPDEPYLVGVYPWDGKAPACTSKAFACFADVLDYRFAGEHRLRLTMQNGNEHLFDTGTLVIEKTQ